MVNIPWAGAETVYTQFLSSPLVIGAAQWIVGIGIGAFALAALLQALRK